MIYVIDFILRTLRHLAHIIIPRGASPEVYRRWMRALYRFLVYDSKTMTVRVRRGLLVGCKKYGPFIESDFDFALGRYEPEVRDALCEICHPGMTVFDVGAHAGYITLLLSKLVGETGNVHAFEPITRNIPYLLETFRINNLHNIIIPPVAISDVVGAAQISCGGIFDGCATLMAESHGHYRDKTSIKISVKTITLDKYCVDAGISHVDLVKMDIEGAEMLALAGMSKILSFQHRPFLIVEFWGRRNVVEGTELLHRSGYKIKVLSAWSGVVDNNLVDIQTVLGVPAVYNMAN